MLRHVRSFLQTRASWPVIAGLLAVVGVLAVVLNGTDLPFSTPTIEEYSEGVRILDMRWSYGPDDAYLLFERLGADGRRAYLTLHLLPDLLFPISYSLAFAFTSAWFLVRLLPLGHPLQWLSLMPLVAGLADILENVAIAVANAAYPNRIDWLTQLASVLTRIKFGLMPVGVVLLISMVALWFVRGRPASNVAPSS